MPPETTATSVAVGADMRADGRISRSVWRITVIVILGSFMSVLDQTIVNVALESLSRNLHTKLSGVQWVVSAYMLALAAVIPLTAWIERRFGAKRVYLAAIVLFALASALCGTATSIGELIIFRVIQGICGGMIIPIGQVILVRAAGHRHLPRVLGAMTMVMLVSPIFGPTLGGALIDNVGWRWIFYLNVPIGVIAVVAGSRGLPADSGEDAGRFDVLGLAVVATGLVGVSYGLAEVGSSGSGILHVLVPLVVGSALIIAFVFRAIGMEKPLLDLRLYADKAFSAASVSIFCYGAVMFGGMILMPLYLQTIRHQSAMATGLLMAPRGAVAALGTWVASRATDRIGAGTTTIIGGLIAAAGTVPLAMIGARTSFALLCVFMAVGGFGLGLAPTPVMTTAYRHLRPEQLSDAAPQLTIIMRIGGSIAIAMLTVVLQHGLLHAGHSAPAQATAYGTAFWWVVGFALVAVLPPTLLVMMERGRAADVLQPTLEEEAATGSAVTAPGDVISCDTPVP